MTANAVIEAIENLPPSERAKVAAYLHDLDAGSLRDAPADPASANDPVFLAAADRLACEALVASQGEHSVVSAYAHGLHLDLSDPDAAYLPQRFYKIVAP